MNLPNKLTMLRVILIPFFVFFLLTDYAGGAGKWIALGIFALASLTDMLDGQIARRRNLITNFGKFMDPIADKLLVCSALIAFVQLGLLPAWIVIILIAREFIVSGFRLVASDSGIVLAAGWWGKFKTAFQMIMCIMLIINLDYKAVNIAEQALIYISLALSVISMVDYIVRNRNVISDM
ncbi:MAG: CDP-diacylglycerol--glycerol-3-phosphate 3-phosphatidyltransferase [Butyrivibrio sp.]|nr:CDP-diacylglycerol--glycerol-3-phosphate 3-phosphatidyltransferase [Butyrivibrio sp.]